jgi:hypothetical protein
VEGQQRGSFKPGEGIKFFPGVNIGSLKNNASVIHRFYGTIGIEINGSVEYITAVKIVISGNVGTSPREAKPERSFGTDYHDKFAFMNIYRSNGNGYVIRP